MNNDLLEQYEDIDWNALLRKDLGSHSLEDAKTNLDRIKQIFDDILGYTNVDDLSSDYLASVEAQLHTWIEFCEEIKNFGDTAKKQFFIDRISQEETNIFIALNYVISYVQTFDPKKDEQLKRSTLEVEKRIKQLDAVLTEAEKLSQNAKKGAVKREISTYGNYFGNEATKNRKKANHSFIWMIISIILTAVISIFILGAININISDKRFWFSVFNAINSQNILIKFVVISLCVYVITHFSKVHSAEKHLYNINTQKQNALESHKQILGSVIATESENEKEIRNSILLELTKAIFDAKDTGYLKTRTQMQSPVSQVINKWTGTN